MNRLANVGTALALAGLIAAGLTACSVTDGAKTPVGNPSATVAPETPAFVPKAYGDAITMTDADGNPVVITDEYGSYTRLTISPTAQAMTLNEAVFDPNLADGGWTNEDILSAQQYVVRFLVEETMDSIAVDGDTGWERWKTEVAPTYISTSIDVNQPAADSDRSPIILNNPNGVYPIWVRDGEPRIKTATVAVERLNNFAYEGKNYIAVSGTAEASYRATDESVIASSLKLNPEGTTAEDVIASFPELGDGVENERPISFDYRYTVGQQDNGQWLIAGAEVYYKGLTN